VWCNLLLIWYNGAEKALEDKYVKVLKYLALSLLSFLLFLSLAIFGLAFTVNSTLLNPEFVISEVDKLDMSAVSRELVGDYVAEEIVDQLPPELQANAAGFVREAVYDIVSDLEPFIKQEINKVVHAGYSFMLGESDSLRAVISLEPLKEHLRESLRDVFWQGFQQSVPAEFAGLPQPQLQQYFEQYYNQYYQEFSGQIPSSLVIDEGYIPTEVMEQITRVRQYIGYFQTGYYALIGFMVLLILLIILINRNVRGSTRDLGITLLIYGALEFAGVFLARNFLPDSLPLSGIPASIQMWVLGLTSDLIAPLQTFSIGVMVAGVVLLIVSFVYKPGEVEE